MDIDQFLEGGFEGLSDAQCKSKIPGRKKTKSTGPQAGPKAVPRISAAGKVVASKSKRTAAVDEVQQEIKSHKEQLEALKMADPDFYQYLQESDKGLLDFSDEDLPDSELEVDEPAEKEGSKLSEDSDSSIHEDEARSISQKSVSTSGAAPLVSASHTQ
jgi:hypothetical protein